MWQYTTTILETALILWWFPGYVNKSFTHACLRAFKIYKTDKRLLFYTKKCRKM